MSSTYFSRLSASLRYRPLTSLLACSAALGTGYFAPLYYDAHRRRSELCLNSTNFTPYTLIAKHRISSSSAIFVLRPPPSQDATSTLCRTWAADSLWSVQAKQPQLQIGREYTPMPPSPILDSLSSSSSSSSLTSTTGTAASGADIHLLIRREKNGEMTTYLHGLHPPLATVNLRGPYQDVRIPPHVDEVLFIAGGTGISPALQVAHIMASRPGSKVTILWANRRREECMRAPVAEGSVVAPGLWTRAKRALSSSSNSSADQKQPGSGSRAVGVRDAVEAVVREGMPSSADKGLVVRILEDMQARSPGLRVEYFVDEEDSFIKHTDVRKILAQSSPPPPPSSSSLRSSSTLQAKAKAAARESTTAPTTHAGSETPAKLILVGGPNGFVDYWAGRKRMHEGREVQGPLGGALGEMELYGWKVWKL